MNKISVSDLTKPYLHGFCDFYRGKKFKNTQYKETELNDQYLEGYIHYYRHLSEGIVLDYARRVLDGN